MSHDEYFSIGRYPVWLAMVVLLLYVIIVEGIHEQEGEREREGDGRGLGIALGLPLLSRLVSPWLKRNVEHNSMGPYLSYKNYLTLST